MSTFHRSELARILAVAIWRMHQAELQRIILSPQNLAPSAQDYLDVPAKTLLTVSTTVNTNGEQGDA